MANFTYFIPVLLGHLQKMKSFFFPLSAFLLAPIGQKILLGKKNHINTQIIMSILDEILQLRISSQLYFKFINAIFTFTGYYEDIISSH